MRKPESRMIVIIAITELNHLSLVVLIRKRWMIKWSCPICRSVCKFWEYENKTRWPHGTDVSAEPSNSTGSAQGTHLLSRAFAHNLGHDTFMTLQLELVRRCCLVLLRSYQTQTILFITEFTPHSCFLLHQRRKHWVLWGLEKLFSVLFIEGFSKK